MREWLHPGVEVEDRPWRATPLTAAAAGWQWVPPRRIPAYVEASIRHGLQWTVFEPNAEQLWAEVRRQVEDFLIDLWREGHLQGDKPDQAYFVKCDRSTMNQNDIDHGRLVVLVGVATLRPAEFVIIRIGMWTAHDDDDGQTDPDDD